MSKIVEPGDRNGYDRESHSGQVWLASGINLLAGLWLIVSPWVLGYADAFNNSQWNAVIVGAIIAAIAAIRLFITHTAGWLSWVNVALGLWLIASPWVFDNSDVSEIFWNDIIVGAIVVLFGAWSALATETE